MPYAFSSNEYLSIHPIHLDSTIGELRACSDMLWVLAEHAERAQEQGLSELIALVGDRLEGAEQRLAPDAVREHYDNLHAEVCHAN